MMSLITRHGCFFVKITYQTMNSSSERVPFSQQALFVKFFLILFVEYLCIYYWRFVVLWGFQKKITMLREGFIRKKKKKL